MKQQACAHVEAITAVTQPRRRECEDRVKVRSRWVHLRTYQTCGVTLCCDSSPQRHVSAHARATKHPVIASAEPATRARAALVRSHADELREMIEMLIPRMQDKIVLQHERRQPHVVGRNRCALFPKLAED